MRRGCRRGVRAAARFFSALNSAFVDRRIEHALALFSPVLLVHGGADLLAFRCQWHLWASIVRPCPCKFLRRPSNKILPAATRQGHPRACVLLFQANGIYRHSVWLKFCDLSLALRS